MSCKVLQNKVLLYLYINSNVIKFDGEKMRKYIQMRKTTGTIFNRILEPRVIKANVFYIVLIGIIVLIALISPEKDLSLVQAEIFPLNDQWKVLTESNSFEDVSLPYSIKGDKTGDVFSITKTTNEDFKDERFIRIRASMQDITVIAKGEVIYESKRNNEGVLTFPEVSIWHLVKIPRNMMDEELTIEFSTRIETFKGIVNPIYYGTEGALLRDLIARNYSGIIVGIIMLLAGIISIIVSFALRKLDDRRLFYIGIFSIAASIWMLSELRILQFVTGNRFILGGISYLMVPVIAVSLIRYLGIVILKKYSKFIDAISVILGSSVVLLLIFQMIGLLPFISGVAYVNALLGLIIIWVVLVIFYEAAWMKNKNAKKYGLYMSVLVVSLSMEIFIFFIKDFERMSHYSKLGFAIFLCCMLWESISYFNSILALNHKTKFLEEMAYKDSLVGGNNRAAYERDLDLILDSHDYKSFRLVLIDINRLKQINDVFGHSTGDNAIIRGHQLMCRAFENIGTCYRLGGDEFACIITETNEEVFNEAIKALNQEIEREDNLQKYPFSLAIGDGLYEKDNIDGRKKFSAFFHEVDQRMYRKKKRRYSDWAEA
jgi:diguanylate cyclase (GGDEF)-like protein